MNKRKNRLITYFVPYATKNLKLLKTTQTTEFENYRNWNHDCSE